MTVTRDRFKMFSFPKCVLLSCLSPQFVCYFLLSYDGQRKIVFTIKLIKFSGCLHDTGATFAPERVHSGSLSWLFICLHDTTTKCYAGASHPGVSSPRFSHRGENFTPVRNLATVSCKRETTTHFGVKSVCR